MCARVVCDFCESEILVPFLWSMICKQLDILFECPIGAFGLSIGLWMIGCGESKCGLQLFEEFAPKR